MQQEAVDHIGDSVRLQPFLSRATDYDEILEPLHNRTLFRVASTVALGSVPAQALDPATLDPLELPYGAVALPTAAGAGSAVVVFKQPALQGRTDILLLEIPAELTVASPITARAIDPRRDHAGQIRVRIAMSLLPNDAGALPASYAIVRFALKPETKALLSKIRYTIRPGDRAGWFELGDDAFPDTLCVHGFPDIATREQGSAGIRGPSYLMVGLNNGIRSSHFQPHRSRPLEPGERVIYELHIGTFTAQGDFASAAHRLAGLAGKGVTTLQLMPLDIASGAPGWTYDQTRTGAVENQSYGGSRGLIEFVERAHELGLEVIVDKQYNHEGPEQDSRSQILPRMFTRQTRWGAGLSGNDVPSYPQIVKLIGEELAFWVAHFGIDGFRLDATNRMPWEMHEQIATFGQELARAAGKPLYLLSEYAESEEPKGRRAPTGHQYADQTGRFLMKLLELTTAAHVTGLPTEAGSVLRPMLKAARRGWWHPGVPSLSDPLRGGERSTTLLWNHDWIGNRFGGERLNQLVTFPVFKTILTWQFLGQWTPFLFMGTERSARTPWFFFTGHQDTTTNNNVSAYYVEHDGKLVLQGGRFHELQAEAEAAGLREAIAFSADGTLAGVDWKAFREQKDLLGKPYMDPANKETFEASKLDWSHSSEEQQAVERLFEKLAKVRQSAAVKNEDPRDTQYKAWVQSERIFLLRRREPGGAEFLAFFNLGSPAVTIEISPGAIEAAGCGASYLTALHDDRQEDEWSCTGRYSLWLDTNDEQFGGTGAIQPTSFEITSRSRRFQLPGATALVFSK